MIEEVVRYKVLSGKEFKTEDEAKNYLVDTVYEYLDSRTKNPNFSRSDQYRFITTLIPNYNSLVTLQKYLNDILGPN